MKINKPKIKKTRNIVLIAAIFLILLPIFFSLTLFYIWTADTITKNTVNATLELVNQMNINMASEANRIENEVNLFCSDDDIRNLLTNVDWNQKDSSLYNAFQSINKKITSLGYLNNRSIVVYVNKGGLYFNGNETNKITNIITAHHLLSEDKKSNGRIKWHGVFQMDEQDSFFLVSKKIYDSNFNEVATAFFCYDNPSFYYDLPNLTQSSLTYIINKQGEVLYNQPNDEQSRTTLVSNQFPKLAAGSFYKNVGAHRYLYVFSHINKYEWQTVKVYSVELLLAHVKTTRNLLITLVAICFLLFISFIYFLNRSFFKPLELILGLFSKQSLPERVDGIDDDEHLFSYELSKIKDEILTLSRNNERGSKQIISLIKDQKMVTLDKLQAQINPHFLYNTLTSIKFFALKNDQAYLAGLITSLVKLLRNSVNREGAFIHVKEELDCLNHYIHIQDHIYDANIQFLIHTQAELNYYWMPNFVLQPLIENAIFHGINPTIAGGCIEIKNYCEGNHLHWEVIDNGIGFSIDAQKIMATPSQSNFSNIGLKGIDQKIKLLCGDAFGVEIVSEKEKGTIIKVVLPIISKLEGESP